MPHVLRTHFWVFCTLLSFCASAQSTDSLLKELSGLKRDRSRVLTLHELASRSWDYSFETSLAYSREAYSIAKEMGSTELIAVSATDVGLYYYFTGDYPTARKYFTQALSVVGKENYGEYPAYTLTRMGNLYRVQGDYDSARYYYNKTLGTLQNMTADLARSSVYHNLGWLHYELSEYSNALAMMRKSVQIRYSIKDSLLIAESWKFIGMIHRAQSDFDSANFYFEKVKRIAERYGDYELTIFYHVSIGEMQFAKGQMAEAIGSYRQALDMLSKHKFKRYQAITLKRIAQVYDQLSDFEQANNHFLQALALEEELNSKHEIARTYSLMGWCYTNQRQYTLANQYAVKSLSLMRQVKDNAGIAYVHNLLGTLNFRTKDYKQALHYFDSALLVREQMQMEVYTASTLENKGYVYEAKGDLTLAAQMHRAASEIYKRLQNKRRLANAYNNMGHVLMKQGRLNEAENYLMLSKTTSQEIAFLPELQKTYNNMALLRKTQGRFKEAMQYYEFFIKLNDSLYTVESTAKSLQAQALYDLERKEAQIDQLNLDNQRKETELQLKDDKLRSQYLALLFAIVMVAMLVVLAMVLYRYYRNKKAANSKLELLNFEILEQKEEIQAQAEELQESNEALMLVNRELHEKKEEIEAQSEELREANEAIYLTNANLEKKVAERTQQLRQAYFELDTFFYRSSHDFRRPLTTFMGLAEVAKITLKDANAIHLFDKVKETAISLDKMLMKLQSISDVGFQQLALKEVFFKELLETVLTNYQHEIEAKHIKIVVELKQADVFSYPSLLKIVVENLVENAINFSRPYDPTIIIRSRQEADRFIVEVQDNGQGVSPEYHEKIFDMYFRANPDSKGNGLGLYISRKAVEKLEGIIRISNTVEKGSLFIVDLPNPRHERH